MKQPMGSVLVGQRGEKFGFLEPVHPDPNHVSWKMVAALLRILPEIHDPTAWRFMVEPDTDKRAFTSLTEGETE